MIIQSIINSSISTLQTADVIHDGEISTLQSDMLLKQDIIDVNNLLSSEYVLISQNETLDEYIVNLTSEINGKQNAISSIS